MSQLSSTFLRSEPPGESFFSQMIFQTYNVMVVSSNRARAAEIIVTGGARHG
jgi:hypothetical protein